MDDSEDDFIEQEEEEEEEEEQEKEEEKGEKKLSSKQSKKQSPKKSNKKKTIEETYRKLDHIEHALQRPDMYIGAAKMIEQKMWVYDKNDGMVYRKISFVPGLYKIFDEILVNAADNKIRDPKQSYIKVDINIEQNSITVQNDGEGIPVVIHENEQLYVPELIFGHLLTGSNFDDDVKKVTGGRNGLGAKLANIFSKEFIVETIDSSRNKKFKQVFRNNMGDRDPPQITSCKLNSMTKITFKPDLERFGMTHFNNDIISLMTKRVYDIAGTTSGVRVTLNGEPIGIRSFSKYCELYIKDPTKPKIFEKVNDRWEVCISVSDGEFQQVSFVNSICTTKGGTHVNHVVSKLAKAIGEAVAKKNKGGAPVKPAQVKNHLWVFVNCLIENPAFDSQTKETLQTPVKDFGSECKLSEEILKKVIKSGIVENVLSFVKARQDLLLKKSTGGKKSKRIGGIAKLDDANNAGGKYSNRCTLILTEGDSAKALAVSGLSVVGRDNYGVFPLRGKLLNVREATHKQIMENQEIKSITQIMGLQHGKQYNDSNSLRYGHLMIMADQDSDGSHIKGLVINYIHTFWPSLLKLRGFLAQFITPIVKARKGKRELSFYTMTEYEEWKKQTNGGKGWEIKYYKGLGTSTSKEAKDYFSNIDKHQIDFEWVGDEDGEAIDMAFNKKRAEDRKEWMRKFQLGTYMDYQAETIRYADFINKELIHFSIADCERSIPSVVDGLKPGQRKILYSCFKRNLKKEIKVAQLAGYVAEHSAYHHGEASLMSTIIGMAHNFVGSNNINLLYPSGQFGTRLQGGKDAASPRYIFTRLCDLTRIIFHPDDDKTLKYLDDDGFSIEPLWYIPIIPMCLVNGAEGIGTGWSTFIPNFNPKDIVNNIKHLLKGEPLETMHPWYKNFKGKISWDEKKKNYLVTGVYNKKDENTLEITELPIGVWTQNYKEKLEEMLLGDEKKNKEPIIKDYKEYHTDHTVHFVVKFVDGKLKELEDSNTLEKTMKLTTTISITNLVAFDPEGRIHKYETPQDILKEFYNLRIEYYQKRKDYLVNKLQQEWLKLDNKVRFILAVVKEEIIVRNRKRADLLKELANKGFVAFDKEGKEIKSKEKIEEESEEEKEPEENDEANKPKEKRSGYDYLLSMPLWSLTLEKVQQLIKDREEKESYLNELIKTSPQSIWEKDLEKFLQMLEEWYSEEDALIKHTPKVKSNKTKRKNKKNYDEDDEDDDFIEKKSPKKTKISVKKEKETLSKLTEKIIDKPISNNISEKKSKKKVNEKIEPFFKKKEEKKEIIKDKNKLDEVEYLNISEDEVLSLTERLSKKDIKKTIEPTIISDNDNFKNEKIKDNNKKKKDNNSLKPKKNSRKKEDKELTSKTSKKNKNLSSMNEEKQPKIDTLFSKMEARPTRMTRGKNIKYNFDDDDENDDDDEDCKYLPSEEDD